MHVDLAAFGKVLGADHVLYGNVGDVLRRWRPKRRNPLGHVWFASLSFKVVHVPTGEALWQSRARGIRARLNTAGSSIKAATEQTAPALPACAEPTE